MATNKTVVQRFALEEECIFPGVSKRDFFETNSVVRFASIGNVLLAGCSDGRIFWHRESGWQQAPLWLKQHVNVMVPDGQSVLVGDGACCSGATYRLSLDGTVELIRPVDGQNDRDKRYPENIQGNVYGFARRGDELLVGVGGCAGRHIYRLNKGGQWEYHQNDPQLYVTAMTTGSDGNVYIAMVVEWDNNHVYRYNGETFQDLGKVPGTGKSIFEHDGKMYIGSACGDDVQPWTGPSHGSVSVINGDSVKLAHIGPRGGVDGFFVHKDTLYAFGRNRSDWSSIVLRPHDGEWEVIAKFNQSLEFTVYREVVYAGGRKKDQPVIYRITGF